MGVQTVQERSGEKKSFGYRNENQKTSDLDRADCVEKICWIIVPAAKSEEKNPSDLMYAICVCEICGILFFILNLFKYFVDFVISICLVCLKPDMFWSPRSEKSRHPHQQYSRIYVFALGCHN